MKSLDFIKSLDQQGYAVDLDMDIIKDKEGFRIKAIVSIDGKGTRSLCDYVYEKNETIIHNKFDSLVKIIMDSFNIDISSLESEEKKEKNSKKNKENVDNSLKNKYNKPEKGKIELTEEELNSWNPNSTKVYKDEVERLIENKKLLNAKSNEELIKYIKDFSDGELTKVSQIVPKNIVAFNKYLLNIIENPIKKEEFIG